MPGPLNVTGTVPGRAPSSENMPLASVVTGRYPPTTIERLPAGVPVRASMVWPWTPEPGAVTEAPPDADGEVGEDGPPHPVTALRTSRGTTRRRIARQKCKGQDRQKCPQ